MYGLFRFTGRYKVINVLDSNYECSDFYYVGGKSSLT